MIKKVISVIESILLKFWYYLWMDMQSLWRKRLYNISYKAWDYVRYSSLELVAHEINHKKLVWNTAELWVYQWDFSSKINELFPQRKLYLFDTFEGFDHKDINIEKDNNFSTGDQDFSQTSIEKVMQKMKHPKQCIVKKWYFPDTAEDINDNFVFVSIDTDLYKPIYEWLCFFYPKLVCWWYIFIHDYNNNEYKWAKEAVNKFCKEQWINIFPLSDNRWTAVIIK